MSQLVSSQFSYVAITVGHAPIHVSRDILCITHVFFNSPMKITFHISYRTEHVGINHLTTIDFVLSQISVNCVICHLL